MTTYVGQPAPTMVTVLDPIDIWLAILLGHFTRCVLSVLRFNQGKWKTIAVDLSN